MSKTIKAYRLTIILAVLFCGAFIIDSVLKFHNSVSFSDFLLGRNLRSGLYDYIWFKGSMVVDGEIWRILSWPFLFEGFLIFIIDLPILIIIISTLERMLGTRQATIRLLTMHLVYTGMLWLTMGLAYFTIDIGIASITPFLFGLVGIYLIELFIRQDGATLKTNRLIYWSIVGYISAFLIYLIIQQSDGYALIYAFSIGILLTFFFNYKKCCIFQREVPFYKKKKFYVTYSIIAISILIFLLDVVLAASGAKAELYTDFSFSKWFNYFMYHTGDNNGIISRWLCLNYEDLRNGQIWRMLTLVYSHYGFEHILFNMPAIYLSGRYIEAKYGSAKTLLVFEGSALFTSIYACLTSINSSFSGFGGSSLGIYAFLIIFLLMIFEKGQTTKPHIYELIYVLAYFILGNVPVIGVRGNNHLHSFLFGLMAYFILNGIASKKQQTKVLTN